MNGINVITKAIAPLSSWFNCCFILAYNFFVYFTILSTSEILMLKYVGEWNTNLIWIGNVALVSTIIGIYTRSIVAYYGDRSA